MEIQIVFLCMVNFATFQFFQIFFVVFLTLKTLQEKHFVLQIQITTGPLSKTARRIASCPEANNLTAWKRASLRLNCSEYSEHYTIDVVERKMLYHCLPSSFLNETIEFCGPIAAIQKGLCVCLFHHLHTWKLNHLNKFTFQFVLL